MYPWANAECWQRGPRSEFRWGQAAATTQPEHKRRRRLTNARLRQAKVRGTTWVLCLVPQFRWQEQAFGCKPAALGRAFSRRRRSGTRPALLHLAFVVDDHQGGPAIGVTHDFSRGVVTGSLGLPHTHRKGRLDFVHPWLDLVLLDGLPYLRAPVLVELARILDVENFVGVNAVVFCPYLPDGNHELLSVFFEYCQHQLARFLSNPDGLPLGTLKFLRRPRRRLLLYQVLDLYFFDRAQRARLLVKIG